MVILLKGAPVVQGSMDVSKMKSPCWPHAADDSLSLHFSLLQIFNFEIRNTKHETPARHLPARASQWQADRDRSGEFPILSGLRKPDFGDRKPELGSGRAKQIQMTLVKYALHFTGQAKNKIHRYSGCIRIVLRFLLNDIKSACSGC